MRFFIAVVITATTLYVPMSNYAFGGDSSVVPSTEEIRATLVAAGKENEQAKSNIALSKIGSSIVPSLIEILDDKNENYYVRLDAMSVLGLIKDIRVVESVIKYLNDSNWLIRDGALRTLETITRNSFGRDEDKWLEWWVGAKSQYLKSVGVCANGRNKSVDHNPCWLVEMIAREEMGKPSNPPTSISKCTYGARTVYYKPPRCCDIPSVLWDESGNRICSPDGGLSGRGDGKCKDFFDEKKACEVIWKDPRSAR